MTPSLREDEAREIDWPALAPVAERLALFGFAVLGACFYFFTSRLVNPAAARPLETAVDAWIPFVPETQWIYFFYEAFLFFPLFLVRDLRALRRLIVAFVGMQLVANVAFVVYPVSMTRPIDQVDPARSFLDWALGLNYAIDQPVNCFPSLHVANALFIAFVAGRVDRALRVPTLAVAIGIAISTLTAKHHWFVDAVAGAALAVGFYRFVFLPGIPPDARREDLAYPRWTLALVPGMFVLAVAVLFALYRWGYHYTWPPAR